jgi:hypothetical protein
MRHLFVAFIWSLFCAVSLAFALLASPVFNGPF